MGHWSYDSDGMAVFVDSAHEHPSYYCVTSDGVHNWKRIIGIRRYWHNCSKCGIKVENFIFDLKSAGVPGRFIWLSNWEYKADAAAYVDEDGFLL